MADQGRYYGMDTPRSTGPHPDPLADLMAAVERLKKAADFYARLGKSNEFEASGHAQHAADLRLILSALSNHKE